MTGVPPEGGGVQSSSMNVVTVAKEVLQSKVETVVAVANGGEKKSIVTV